MATNKEDKYAGLFDDLDDRGELISTDGVQESDVSMNNVQEERVYEDSFFDDLDEYGNYINPPEPEPEPVEEDEAGLFETGGKRAYARGKSLLGDLFGAGQKFSESLEENFPMLGSGIIIDADGISWANGKEFAAKRESGEIIEPLESASEYWKEGVDDVEEKHSWEGLKQKFKDGDITGGMKEVILYGTETGIASIPDMIAVVANMPAYVMARSNEMGDIRAENKGKEKADITDYLEAVPGALGSALFERFGVKGITDEAAANLGKDALKHGFLNASKNVAKGTGRAASKEAFTEFVQEGIIEYTTEKLGTGADMSLAEAADRGAAGAVGGGVYGGGAGGAGAVYKQFKGEESAEPPGPLDELDRLNEEREINSQKYRDGEAMREHQDQVRESVAARGGDALEQEVAAAEAGVAKGEELSSNIANMSRLLAQRQAVDEEAAYMDEQVKEDEARAKIQSEAADRYAEGIKQVERDKQAATDKKAMATSVESRSVAIKETAVAEEGRQAEAKTEAAAKTLASEKADQKLNKLRKRRQALGLDPKGDVEGVSPYPSAQEVEAFKGEKQKSSAMAEAFTAAANEAATSPTNDVAPPTKNQLEQGNYKKGHPRVNGLGITIESPAGSTRTAVDGSWSQDMKDDYGYIKGTESAEGKTEQLDVFVGKDHESDSVFIVDQVNKEGAFDEHKVMMSYPNAAAARKAYLRNYPKGFKLGPVSTLSVAEFKEWLKNGDQTVPYSGKKLAGTPKATSATTEQVEEVIQDERARKGRRRSRILFRQGDKSTSDTLAKDLTRPEKEGGGGYTVDENTGERVTDGYSVGQGIEEIIDGHATPEQIEAFRRKYAKELKKKKGNTLGGWYDETDGKTYLDVSVNVKDRAQAVALGKKNSERAIQDLKKGGEGTIRLDQEKATRMRKSDVTKSAAFKKWFGKSKVVDAKGPRIVYHGTDVSFRAFKTPAYFSETAKFAEGWTGTEGANTLPVYLSIQNPYVIDGDYEGRHFEWDAADVARMKSEGFDGVIVRSKNEPDIYAVFDPGQVKSAVGNKGGFDAGKPSVLLRLGDDVEDIIRQTASPDMMDELQERSEGFEDGENLALAYEDALDAAEYAGDRKELNALRKVGIAIGMFRTIGEEEISRVVMSSGKAWDFSMGGQKYVFDENYRTQMGQIGEEIEAAPAPEAAPESFKTQSMSVASLEDVPGDPQRKSAQEMVEFTKKIMSGEIKPNIIVKVKDGKPVRIVEGNHTLRVLRAIGQENVDVKVQEVAADEGKNFKNFFSAITKGLAGKSSTGKTYTPVIAIEPTEALGQFSSEYAKYRGNFDDHIAFSIPGFKEVQILVGSAIAKVYGKGAKILDIGASEGSFVKAVTAVSGAETVALDPNPDMRDTFNNTPVEGSEYAMEALGTRDQEGALAWKEADGTPVNYFDPKGQKFDVIHEAMVFQFISPDRQTQIARVKELLKPGGVAIFEEKMFTEQQESNEVKKNAYKRQYFEQAEMTKKASEVLEGMDENTVHQHALEEVLTANFDNVVEFWDSGNFKGYVVSDSAMAANRLVSAIGNTNTEFSTFGTPRKVTAPSTLRLRKDGAQVDNQTAKVKVKVDKAEADVAIAELNDKLPGMKVNVLENAYQLPGALLDRAVEDFGATVFGAKGLFDEDTGTVYVFSDNHKSVDDLVSTAMHEGVGHKGLRVLFSEPQMNALLDSVYAGANKLAISRIANKYNLDLNKVEDQRIAAEEFIAETAEGDIDATILERVVDAVRQALLNLGILETWTDSDIKALLRRNRSALKRGKPLSRITLPGKGMDRAGAEKALKSISAKLATIDVVVLETPGEAPEKVHAAIRRDGALSTRSAHDPVSGTLYVFSKNHIDAADIQKTVLLEGVSREGLGLILGNRAGAILGDVAKKANRGALERIAREDELNLEDSADELLAAEAYIASKAAAMVRSKEVAGLTEAIKTGMSQLNIAREWSGEEVRELIGSSRKNAVQEDLSRVSVFMEAEVEETGERVSIEERADVAVRRAQKRIDVLNKLEGCLG